MIRYALEELTLSAATTATGSLRALLVGRHERIDGGCTGMPRPGLDPHATVGKLDVKALARRQARDGAYRLAGLVAHQCEAPAQHAAIAERCQHLAGGTEAAALVAGAHRNGTVGARRQNTQALAAPFHAFAKPLWSQPRGDSIQSALPFGQQSFQRQMIITGETVEAAAVPFDPGDDEARLQPGRDAGETQGVSARVAVQALVQPTIQGIETLPRQGDEIGQARQATRR